MLKNNSRTILIILGILSVIVFIGITRHTAELESIPRALSKTNVPTQFNIIGITDSGVPVLLEHEIGLQDEFKDSRSEKKLEKDYRVKILWQKDCKDSKKYSFYIDAKKKESIEETLTAALNDNVRCVTIKILEDNPSTKRQRIYVDYWSDDFNYYSVYAVNNRSVVVLKYGDSTRHDGVMAAFIGFRYMILFYVLGCIVFAVAVWCESEKQKKI